ncbi:MAG: tetratricopeptide repeat protein, partial [Candidatus Subteraquimicrobiales bacterium]|nr:tetratricopeptide repeat protein [Candidatus Subteraquimicrobiales bacterium]
MKVTWMTRQESHAMVQGKVVQTEVVLDIGPGIRPQGYFKPRIHICVEPYLPYIERLRQDIRDDAAYVFQNCTWDHAMKLLPERSVDTVFALDVLEHFEKEEGLRFLEEASRVARRQIIIFTPLGFYPQTYDGANNQDRWGMKGAYWQAHRSGWCPEDFGDDWELVCCKEYHFIDENGKPFKKPFGAIWAFRNLDIQTKEPHENCKNNQEGLNNKAIGKHDLIESNGRSKELIRGEELFSQGFLEDAKKCFLKLMNGSNPCKEALNNLGVLAYQEGNFNEAVHYLTESLRIDPLYEDALANYSELLGAIKRGEAACGATSDE